MRSVLVAILLLSPLPLTAHAADETAVRSAYANALANPDDSATIDTLLGVLPTVEQPFPGANSLYVFEGDLLSTRDEIVQQLKRKAVIIAEDERTSKGPPPAVKTELIVNTDESGDVKIWKPLTGKTGRKMKYAVIRSTFPTLAQYTQVVKDVADAAKEWLDKCPECQIELTHQSDLDGKNVTDFPALANADTLRFIVMFQDVGGEFIAAAFFPNDAIQRRLVRIDPSYFANDLSFDRVGVLRHELGHVLGYRHEHIRSEAGCWSEDNNWKPITRYDSKSVMHYLCGAGGSSKLRISDLDEAGHRQQYGLKGGSPR